MLWLLDGLLFEQKNRAQQQQQQNAFKNRERIGCQFFYALAFLSTVKLKTFVYRVIEKFESDTEKVLCHHRQKRTPAFIVALLEKGITIGR
jgi:hypothetical protein